MDAIWLFETQQVVQLLAGMLAALDSMMTRLTLNLTDPDHCDISPSGIPYDDFAFSRGQSTTEVAGIQLTLPTMRGGFGLLTRVKSNKTDPWSFTRVFSNELWALIVCSATFLALLVWLSEKNFHNRGMGKVKYPLAFRAGMYEAFYRVFGKLWNVVSDLNVVSIISKIISLAWGVATIVLIANYTAALSGYLTAVKLDISITDVAQLKTGTNTDQDGLDAMNKVRTGEWDAMLMDKPWLRYYTAQMCDVLVLDVVLTPLFMGWGLNANLPPQVLDAMNHELLAMQVEGVQEMLEAAWLPDATCDYRRTGPIPFADMAGLWVILGASFGLSVLLLLLPHLSSKLDVDVAVSRSASMVVARSVLSALSLRMGLSRPPSTTATQQPDDAEEGVRGVGAQGLVAGSPNPVRFSCKVAPEGEQGLGAGGGLRRSYSAAAAGPPVGILRSASRRVQPSAVPAVEGEEGGVRAGLGLNPTKAPPPSMQPPAGTQLLDRCPSPTAVVDDGDDTPGAATAVGLAHSRSASPDEITTASSQGSEDVAAVVHQASSLKAWKVEVLEAAPVQELLPSTTPLVLDLARMLEL
ncbi:glutamate [NMDA] receptor subunit 1 [Haematococcus lacustris]|uniref:Glutamate [NMDA] receptor subunit 1 n=1 Tax=Haematococcus lacustris TaxID=44745 RepID=A0A699Y923_HAELA|nr:glutamate [NMDA] receptor subunit 1 [Haematococcus lacustris]